MREKKTRKPSYEILLSALKVSTDMLKQADNMNFHNRIAINEIIIGLVEYPKWEKLKGNQNAKKKEEEVFKNILQKNPSIVDSGVSIL